MCHKVLHYRLITKTIRRNDDHDYYNDLDMILHLIIIDYSLDRSRHQGLLTTSVPLAGRLVEMLC